VSIYIIIEEDINGARVVYSGTSKLAAEEFVKETFPRDLRWLMDNIWRCGSSIISIQESELHA
jgi:hypothetical protein